MVRMKRVGVRHMDAGKKNGGGEGAVEVEWTVF